MKLPIEYVSRGYGSSPSARCHGLVAATGIGSQAHLAHQASHALLAAFDALRLQLGMHPWTSIHLPMLMKDLGNLLGQFAIFSLMNTGFSTVPLIIAALTHLSRSAQDRDRILLLLLFNKGILYSGLREKMANASDRISPGMFSLPASCFLVEHMYH